MPISLVVHQSRLDGSALQEILDTSRCQTGDMCTRILDNRHLLTVVVGRTMDWPESTEPVLTVFPRGIQRDGGLVDGRRVVDGDAVTWTSKYGSLVTTIYGIGTADGVNERGVAAHLLFFKPSDFGSRDLSVPGLSAALWVQYLLDNAASVAEAIALVERVQLVSMASHGVETTVHLAIEDASGDSAVIEFVEGRCDVYHGHEYRVMTNDPSYDEHLRLIAEFDFSDPSSEMSLPGNVNPRDRFARATYFAALLPEPADVREAVAGVLAIARNVSVPFGAPYRDFGIYNTEYRTVTDLVNRRYFFELTTAPNVVWADLSSFDLDAGATTHVLDPDDVDLSGDVSGQFHTATAPF